MNLDQLDNKQAKRVKLSTKHQMSAEGKKKKNAPKPLLERQNIKIQTKFELHTLMI